MQQSTLYNKNALQFLLLVRTLCRRATQEYTRKVNVQWSLVILNPSDCSERNSGVDSCYKEKSVINRISMQQSTLYNKNALQFLLLVRTRCRRATQECTKKVNLQWSLVILNPSDCSERNNGVDLL